MMAMMMAAASGQAPAQVGGDWICPKCNNKNFARREICNTRTCQAKRPNSFGGATPGDRGGLKPGEDCWKCPSCGNKNFMKREVCNSRNCQEPRPEDAEEAAAEHKVRGGLKEGEEHWECPQCSNLNFANRTTCNTRTCRAPKPEGVEMKEYNA
jgi:predicted nucleic-acid-binding Zn-ribbon protein